MDFFSLWFPPLDNLEVKKVMAPSKYPLKWPIKWFACKKKIISHIFKIIGTLIGITDGIKHLFDWSNRRLLTDRGISILSSFGSFYSHPENCERGSKCLCVKMMALFKIYNFGEKTMMILGHDKKWGKARKKCLYGIVKNFFTLIILLF